MVQVDVFWSYGLGAGFAVAAARQLRLRDQLRKSDAAGELAAELETAGEIAPSRGGAWPNFLALLQNRFMVVNVLYAAMFFAPSGIYLLWGFPNWETMQAGSHSMPAWLIVLFAITNVTQAIVGFWVTERLIVNGRQYLGLLQAWAGYFGMFFLLVNGWDKTGWHRFFSEDRADFKTWSSEPAIDQVTGWLTSEVALTLYAMGAILIPVMALIMIRSMASGYRIGGEYQPDRKPVGAVLMTATTVAILLSGVPAAIVAHQLILWLGWILGATASAAVIFVVMLWSRTGLLYRGYRLLALEDAAYLQISGGGPASGDAGGESKLRATPVPSYSNQ